VQEELRLLKQALNDLVIDVAFLLKADVVVKQALGILSIPPAQFGGTDDPLQGQWVIFDWFAPFNHCGDIDALNSVGCCLYLFGKVLQPQEAATDLNVVIDVHFKVMQSLVYGGSVDGIDPARGKCQYGP
jgi:hypothetical protein